MTVFGHITSFYILTSFGWVCVYSPFVWNSPSPFEDGSPYNSAVIFLRLGFRETAITGMQWEEVAPMSELLPFTLSMASRLNSRTDVLVPSFSSKFESSLLKECTSSLIANHKCVHGMLTTLPSCVHIIRVSKSASGRSTDSTLGSVLSLIFSNVLTPTQDTS